MPISTTPSRIARKLTIGATAVNLLTLLQAINANISGSAKELIIQGLVGNTGTITIGDVNVAVADGGFLIPATPAASIFYREQVSGNGSDRIALSDIWLIASAAAQGVMVTARF